MPMENPGRVHLHIGIGCFPQGVVVVPIRICGLKSIRRGLLFAITLELLLSGLSKIAKLKTGDSSLYEANNLGNFKVKYIVRVIQVSSLVEILTHTIEEISDNTKNVCPPKARVLPISDVSANAPQHPMKEQVPG